ncbi:MAG: hypothetical protein DRP56_05990 [Planctomycetota bacterium]|nr:MAG: hypothetical protein DRP56_05990 [Planctomycetota bacterium]
MAKQTTKAFRLECAKDAVEAYSKGITYTDTAKKLGVNTKSLWYWVRQYKKGELSDGGDRQSDFSPTEDSHTKLVSVMDEVLNGIGSVKTEMVEVLVFSESVENSIRVAVERPDTRNTEKFDKELENRILSKLEWCFAMKGFKFNNKNQ